MGWMLRLVQSMGTELSKQQCREGGDKCGRRAMDSSSSTAAGGKAPTTQIVVGKWAGWLQGAEVLYLQGKFRAFQEVSTLLCTSSLPVDNVKINMIVVCGDFEFWCICCGHDTALPYHTNSGISNNMRPPGTLMESLSTELHLSTASATRRVGEVTQSPAGSINYGRYHPGCRCWAECTAFQRRRQSEFPFEIYRHQL